MMYVIAIALVLVAILIAKFTGFLFKAKDAKLVKEDQALKTQQKKLEAEVIDLKTKQPVKTLSADEISKFWEEN